MLYKMQTNCDLWFLEQRRLENDLAYRFVVINYLIKYTTMVILKIEIIFIFNTLIPDDDSKMVETLKTKMISIIGVTIVVYLLIMQILSGYQNFLLFAF